MDSSVRIQFYTILVLFIQNVVTDEDVIDLSHIGARMFGRPDLEVGKNLNNLKNPSVNVEELGTYAEGDILLPRPLGRNGVIIESYRWPDGIIPFEVRGSFNDKEMALLEQAIGEYHKKTCVKFVPRSASDKDFISIQNGQSGCWSSVGRAGGPQVVNLQTPGCVTKVGTVIHELMHAVGFLHEQNREERDDFIIIQFENVKPGTEVNFSKAPKGLTSGFGVQYDYGSIMHYSGNAFSINGNPTIISKDKNQKTMGQREGFSSKDVEKIWKMYDCKATTDAGGHKLSILSALEQLANPVGDLLNTIFPAGDQEEIAT